MGNLFKILGIIFLVLIVGFVGMLLWSHSKGAGTQESFYALVQTGDPQKLIERFHPDVAEQVDPPILQVWMNTVNEKLGAFKGLAGSKFSTSAGTQNGHSYVKSSGRVQFEKGTGDSELELQDDKIMRFKLVSDQLPTPWLKELPDTTFYVEAGSAWLELLLKGDPLAARAEAHENLQARLPLEKFQASLAHVKSIVGDLESITPTTHDFTPAPAGDSDTPPALVLYFDLTCSKRPAEARLRYQFLGWKAHLVGFNVKPKTP